MKNVSYDVFFRLRANMGGTNLVMIGENKDENGGKKQAKTPRRHIEYRIFRTSDSIQSYFNKVLKRSILKRLIYSNPDRYFTHILINMIQYLWLVLHNFSFLFFFFPERNTHIPTCIKFLFLSFGWDLSAFSKFTAQQYLTWTPPSLGNVHLPFFMGRGVTDILTVYL